jgi:hypothetical protein
MEVQSSTNAKGRANALPELQSAFILLRIMKGFSAPEAIEAAARATALAEKSGNLAQLSAWVKSQCLSADPKTS